MVLLLALVPTAWSVVYRGTALPAHPSAARVSPPICASAELLLERAPPAPPPGLYGGDGGDGDDGQEFLRLLTSSESAEAIVDWQGRGRVYSMSDTAGIRERQLAALDVLMEMEAHRAKEGGKEGPRRLLIGLYDDQCLLAISSAEISVRDGLTVRHLTVHPRDLNNDDSTTALRMLHGLHILAETIDVSLDLVPLRKSGNIVGMANMNDRSWEQLGE